MRLKDKFKISKVSHINIVNILLDNPKENTDDIKIRTIAVPLESGDCKARNPHNTISIQLFCINH